MYFSIIAKELAGCLLFFYAVGRFSKIIMRQDPEKMRPVFEKIVKTPLRGLIAGTIATMGLQSSKAVVALTTTLVNAEVISFAAALPVVFGAPLGISSTAFLVSLKWEPMEEVIIIVGAILKKTRFKTAGHLTLYLGFLLFALELMTNATTQLKDVPEFQKIFSFSTNDFVLFFAIIVITFCIQSGALVISILMILTNGGIIAIEDAIVMAIGSTAGSAVTEFILIPKITKEGKKLLSVYAFAIVSLSAILIVFAPALSKLVGFFKNPGIALAVINALGRITISLSAFSLFRLWNAGGFKVLKPVKNV